MDTCYTPLHKRYKAVLVDRLNTNKILEGRQITLGLENHSLLGDDHIGILQCIEAGLKLYHSTQPSEKHLHEKHMITYWSCYTWKQKEQAAASILQPTDYKLTIDSGSESSPTRIKVSAKSAWGLYPAKDIDQL